MPNNRMAAEKKSELGATREKLAPIYEMAIDVGQVTGSDIERLLPRDFEIPAEVKKEKRRIGFLC